ncbi:HipA domain-containing protein [Candidatus Poribacteria bacterium]|nr:HipA domain-containing protein [Candidatus Poribacteria bacterium]
MICHICGEHNEDQKEYHIKCVKKLFGINEMPKIDLSLYDINIEAQKMAGKLSISGVQPKISVKLSKPDNKIIVVAENGEYIVKPQSQTFYHLPENEFTCTILAKKIGINVPGFALLKLKDNSLAYIVKRFDRNKGNKIHVEDFGQILGKTDKYKGSYEEIGKKIKSTSEIPGLDVQLLFERILFYYIIGNGDAHFKNFSIQYGDEGQIRLAPAYDIASSKIVIPSEEDLALTINGKKNNIKKNDFYSFGNYLGINKKYTEEVFDKYLNTEKLLNNITEINNNISEKLKLIIKERVERFVKFY